MCIRDRGTPRQNYSNAGSVNQFEINRLNQNADKIKDAAMSVFLKGAKNRGQFNTDENVNMMQSAGDAAVGGMSEADLIARARSLAEANTPSDEMSKRQMMSRFLIPFGLDLMSRSPTGKGFTGLLSTAASSAKAPTAQLFQDIDKRRDDRTDRESSLFSALLSSGLSERRADKK